MGTSRDSKSHTPAPASDENLQPFVDLAYSRSAFATVGRIDEITEAPGSKSIFGDTELELGDFETSNPGSGVYLGKQIVITSAHFVPAFVKDGEYINPLTQHLYFSIKGKDGDQVYNRVIGAVRHPGYIKPKNGLSKVHEMRNDIAVLLLDGDPVDASKTEIDYKSFGTNANCTAVGFPTRFMVRDPDDKIKSSEKYFPFDRNMFAVKVPYVEMNQGILKNKVGFEQENPGDAEHLKKSAYDPLVSGVSDGMVGGGLFSPDHKLIGIIGGQTPSAEFKKNPKATYSAIVGDRNWAVSLSNHEEWLTQTIKAFQDQMPQFDEGLVEWRKRRKAYETERDAPIGFGLFGRHSTAVAMNIKDTGAKVHSGPVPSTATASVIPFPSTSKLG